MASRYAVKGANGGAYNARAYTPKYAHPIWNKPILVPRKYRRKGDLNGVAIITKITSRYEEECFLNGMAVYS